MVDAWGVSRSSSLRLHHSDDGLGSKDHSGPGEVPPPGKPNPAMSDHNPRRSQERLGTSMMSEHVPRRPQSSHRLSRN
jgi:hypothetical protein